MEKDIVIKGLRQNNLKNITVRIPKGKIVVFTGVSGSGKSSIVFDTIGSESARQMNETYPAFIRSRLPKYPAPDCDSIENLSPSVIIDQAALGSNPRSTVGTVSEIYSALRVLFSRAGQPYAGHASMFSFNDPAGMCPECSGMGLVTDIDLDAIIDREKSLNEGALKGSTFCVGSWYWKQIIKSAIFDADKKLKNFTEKEFDLLMYGQGKELTGVYNIYKRRYITRDSANIATDKASEVLIQKECPLCRGKRLNRKALACWIDGFSIAEMSAMQLTDLRDKLRKLQLSEVQSLVDGIVCSLNRMIDIGLGYLSLDRTTDSLSGGEAQRIKLVRYLGSSLTDMLYIFDEPSTGMHPRDVYRMDNLLIELKKRGNSVLVVEHDEDVIAIADEVIDIGPLSGTQGGTVVFQGSYEELKKADTITAKALSVRKRVPEKFRKPTGWLPLRDVNLHNLRHCDADIPLGCICSVTGVAGSGKSSLMEAFAQKYSDRVVRIDQKPITATNRSNPASYMGFLDLIRKDFAEVNKVDEGLFSYNSTGACPHCKGKGVVVTELAFMDPVVTTCEHCRGKRFSDFALLYKLRGKSILDVLSMTVSDALEFFGDNRKIRKKLEALRDTGLSYLTLGQPLSTLSGGERQRLKLAERLGKRAEIYIFDEPTTGLHPSDTDKLMALFANMIKRGCSIILIEHNTEVMKISDYIIDIGPDGGNAGGRVVFAGTPREMLEAETITAKCLKAADEGRRISQEELARLSFTEEAAAHNEEENKMDIRLNPIGRIDAENGEFSVALDKKYAAALRGLEGFSHVQVIWWFDGCDNSADRNVLVNTKPYTHGPDELGTFATRSPERPNPIAVTTAEVLGIDYEHAAINLAYIDALTGSPVLDIKPYTPSLDKVENAAVPSWCSHWPHSYEASGDFDWSREFNF